VTRKQLEEQRGAKLSRMEALNGEIGENVETPEQLAEYTQLKADIEAIDSQIVALSDASKRAADRAAELEAASARKFAAPNINVSRRTGPQPLSVNAGNDEVVERTSRAFKAWANFSEASHEDIEDARALGCNPASKEITIRLGAPARNSADVQKLSMGISQIGSGGVFIQPQFVAALEEASLNYGGLRTQANVIRTETSAEIPYPTINDTSNSGRIVGEATTVTRTSASFNRVKLRAFKYTSDTLPVSRELLRDAAIDIPGLISRLLMERIFRAQAEHFISGNGSTQPNGILTAGTLGVTAAATDAITLNEVIQLTDSLDGSYLRQNPVLLMNKTTRSTLRQITSGTVEYLWGKDVANGAPPTFNGYPIFIDDNMPDIGTSTKPIAFGVMNKYIVRDVQSIRLQRFTELLGESDQDGFLAFMESDGNVLDAGTPPNKYNQMHA